MTNKINYKELESKLNDLVLLRNECSKSNDPVLTKSFKQLHEECLNNLDFLVDARTNKYKKFSNYEDLKQDGRLAMILALRSYKPDKGGFLWWLNKYVKTKISREANKHSTIKIPMKDIKNNQPHKVDEIPVMIDDDFDLINKDYQCSMIRTAVSSLPEEERDIIELSFAFNSEKCSMEKISEKMNMKKFHCIKLLNKAKNNLKKKLKELC